MQVNFYFLVHSDRGTGRFAAGLFFFSVNTWHPPPASSHNFYSHDQIGRRWLRGAQRQPTSSGKGRLLNSSNNLRFVWCCCVRWTVRVAQRENRGNPLFFLPPLPGCPWCVCVCVCACIPSTADIHPYTHSCTLHRSRTSKHSIRAGEGGWGLWRNHLKGRLQKHVTESLSHHKLLSSEKIKPVYYFW